MAPQSQSEGRCSYIIKYTIDDTINLVILPAPSFLGLIQCRKCWSWFSLLILPSYLKGNPCTADILPSLEHNDRFYKGWCKEDRTEVPRTRGNVNSQIPHQRLSPAMTQIRLSSDSHLLKQSDRPTLPNWESSFVNLNKGQVVKINWQTTAMKQVSHLLSWLYNSLLWTGDCCLTSQGLGAGVPPPAYAEFAPSPHVQQVTSRYSRFLPQAKDMKLG